MNQTLASSNIGLSSVVSLDFTSVGTTEPWVHILGSVPGADIRVQMLQYYEIDDVVGDTVVMECNNDEFGTDYRFGFNGMTKDNNLKGIGNSLDFGARIMDPRLGKWLSLDPLQEKYPRESPYSFVGNSPIIYIDPDGREKIVVSGGEYSASTRYKYNFIEPAITQLKSYKQQANDEKVTWAIMSAGYSKDDINAFKSVAAENKVALVILNSSEDLLRYINRQSLQNKDPKTGEIIPPTASSEERIADPITDMTVFGHGVPCYMEFAYGQESREEFTFGIASARKLNKDAFESAEINLFTCNSATPTDKQMDDKWSSLAGSIASKTGTNVLGYYGKTDYQKMNTGETLGDKMNRNSNGFNTRGSKKLPVGGNRNDGITPSTRHLFKPTPPKK